MAAKTVAVYGSGRVKQDHPDYIAARAIGKALAEAGYTVMTGGYSGIMEAASRGAAEAGGHVIGVTTARIEARRPDVCANPWVKEEFRQSTLRGRMMFLTLKADAYVIMPGGTGTLNELAVAWELVRVGDVPPKPIICYGPYWLDMLATFRNSPHLAADAWTTLSFADNPDEVVSIIKARVNDES